RRMVLESLPLKEQQETIAGLAVMMGLVEVVDSQYKNLKGEILTLSQIQEDFGPAVLSGTLIRRIEENFFDVDAVHWQKNATLNGGQQPIAFEMKVRDLPEPVPTG